MAISLVTVGGKITAALQNAIIGAVNKQGLTSVIPNAVTGSGATLGTNGLVTLTSVAASTAVTIQGCFTGSFENYRVVIQMRKTGTTSTEFPWSFITGTNTVYSGNTYFHGFNGQASGTATAGLLGPTTVITGGFGLGAYSSAIIDFMSPFANAAAVIVSSLATNWSGTASQYMHTATAATGTAITGFTFTVPSGVTLTSGTIRIYGYSDNS